MSSRFLPLQPLLLLNKIHIMTCIYPYGSTGYILCSAESTCSGHDCRSRPESDSSRTGSVRPFFLLKVLSPRKKTTDEAVNTTYLGRRPLGNSAAGLCPPPWSQSSSNWVSSCWYCACWQEILEVFLIPPKTSAHFIAALTVHGENYLSTH